MGHTDFADAAKTDLVDINKQQSVSNVSFEKKLSVGGLIALALYSAAVFSIAYAGHRAGLSKFLMQHGFEIAAVIGCLTTIRRFAQLTQKLVPQIHKFLIAIARDACDFPYRIKYAMNNCLF